MMYSFKRFIITLILLICSVAFAYGGDMKKTIAIDLDGVLDNYTKYTDEIPSIKKGAKDFITKLWQK